MITNEINEEWEVFRKILEDRIQDFKRHLSLNKKPMEHFLKNRRMKIQKGCKSTGWKEKPITNYCVI